MTRGPACLAVLMIALTLAAACHAQQGNVGVIFSEIVYGPSVAANMPSYVELVNVQIANPVVPPPVPIGSAAAGAATIAASVNGGPFQTFVIPVGPVLGGNLQPPPAAQPPVPPANPAVMLLASGPFPAGTVPANVIVIQAPPLFTGANAQLGAPGLPFELCFFNPATGLSDRIHLGPPTATSCPSGVFNNTNTFQPATGKAIRWCYMDSNTDIDFESGIGLPTASWAISPGHVNPQMTHVNGFLFGTTVSAAGAGTQLNISPPGATTNGQFFFPNNARVKSVSFTNAFLTREINNPAFDAIINAPVSLSASFTAQNPSLTNQPNFLPGLQINSELMVIPPPSGFTASLNMPMNISTQVGVNIGLSAAGGVHNIRPERIFSDLVTDSGAFISGGGTATAAEIDVIPPSEGGGNVWCEVIVYDYQGNQYRAKVKNWPPGGACGPPQLGLGTDGGGSCTVMNLCFSPGSMVANIFSASNPATCGGPLLPAGGICPDSTTSWILTPPQLGAAPFFVTADAAGMYLFQVPNGTLSGFAGTTFWGLGIEYTPSGIVQQSIVNSITF